MIDEEKLSDLKNDFSLFIEAGFVAVKQLDEASARRLFQAAQLLRPDSTAPQIGLGYISLNKLEVKEASTIFESVVEKEPENYLARTFLGICYLLSKTNRKKGEEMIGEAIKKAEDPTIHNLGKIALEWAEHDLDKKASKAPFFSSSQKEDKKDNG